jgi:hypothetical protein
MLFVVSPFGAHFLALDIANGADHDGLAITNQKPILLINSCDCRPSILPSATTTIPMRQLFNC